MRRGDRSLRVGSIALGERPDEDLAVDRRTDLEPARAALDPLAVDVVRVVAAELGLRLLDTGLVQGVELVVVGPKGRVGDLDSRLRGLGLGGHRWVSRGAVAIDRSASTGGRRAR